MTTTTEGAHADGSLFMGAAQAEAMLRLIENAPRVRRRYQYFVWMQSHLQPLVAHEVAICGAWQRQRKALALEAFHTVPLPPPVLGPLTSQAGALVQALVRHWVARGCKPQQVNLDELEDPAALHEAQPVLEAGLRQWLLHGVSRPQRPHELESLFLFASTGKGITAAQLSLVELLMPHLHSTYVHMQATERELGVAPPPPAVRAQDVITARERQILSWVREGKSNQEIGEQLGISALTVKNHVQKILRKLGAANRAQAVAKAMTLNLLVAVVDET